MLEGMNGKKGAWVKPGDSSGDPAFPGSYSDYVYVRAPPSDYPKTDQQKRIGQAGRECAKEGRSGKEIHQCIREKF